MDSLIALLAVVVPTSAARGDRVDASVRTLVSARQDPRSGQVETVVPTYALIDLAARDLTNPVFDHMRVIVSGWSAVTGGQYLEERPVSGDLNVGYAEGELLDGRVRLRLGRQLLTAGSARNVQFDGLAEETRIVGGLGLQLHGGAPVTPRFATQEGDLLGGARLFWRRSSETEVGASVVQVMDRRRIARQEVGLDVRWALVRHLFAGGQGFFSIYDQRLAEGDIGVQWDPTATLSVAIDYRRVAPDLFIPRNSVLSVFSEETRNEVGGQVYFKPAGRLRVTGDLHSRVTEWGSGYDFGVRADLSLGRAFGTRVGVEGRALHDPLNGYGMGRLTATSRITEHFLVTSDASAYLFENPVNAQDVSATGTVSVGYEFGHGWQALVSGLGGTTAYLKERFEVMAKLSYGLSWSSHTEVATAPPETQDASELAQDASSEGEPAEDASEPAQDASSEGEPAEDASELAQDASSEGEPAEDASEPVPDAEAGEP